MIDMQLLNDVLLAVAVLVGTASLFAVAMMAAATMSKPGRGPHGRPHGGIRRAPAPRPEPDRDDARPLVLR
jgi:hypothetical protein